MFERTPFDEFAEHIGIDTSLSLLSHLCKKIEEGSDIFEALQSSEVSDRVTKYHALRYRNELLEYEAQIKYAYQAFDHAQLADEYLPSVLRYVSYGINCCCQMPLMNAMSSVGFCAQSVDKYDATIVVTFIDGVGDV